MKAATPKLKKIRRWNIVLHRDLGYFFSSLLIAYCISGIALNHVDDWNPDFIISKENIKLPETYEAEDVTAELVSRFGSMVGESSYKLYDFPTPEQVKIYYDNASLHVDLRTGTGVYEKVSRRPLFYEVNILHRNSLKGWKWAADVFAFMLIAINITGLFVLKGKHGLARRGKWLIAAGMVPPLLAVFIHYLI